jgi:hypothetical protein
MKQIILKRGEIALVDDEDFERINQFEWTKTSRGYARRYVKGGVAIVMHREVLGLSHDDERIADHINGNRLDNTRANLRACTKAQNCLNRALQKNSKSGYRGVCLHKQSGKWQAGINFNGKAIYLGLFQTPEEASDAYKQAAIRLHGEFACFDR